ncbi:MAG TPA: SRPBCC domain-containing protein [Lapillicoccus sp.]|nr:SRPBCC domain-containing protein [Lapillicoccus sp.]
MTDTTQSDQEVRITRMFEASRERVFRAWTDPDDVAVWFSPEPLTVPRDSVRIDLRVGGRYELTMQQPDGVEAPLGFEIVELDPPALLVLRSDPMPEAGMPEPTLVRIELHEEGSGTRMELADGPYPTGFGVHAERGWLSAFGKLASVVSV